MIVEKWWSMKKYFWFGAQLKRSFNQADSPYVSPVPSSCRCWYDFDVSWRRFTSDEYVTSMCDIQIDTNRTRDSSGNQHGHVKSD